MAKPDMTSSHFSSFTDGYSRRGFSGQSNRRSNDEGSETIEYDVAVVGCGPTGATLANLLVRSGVKVLVLDKEPQIYPLPRAVHFDDETMRIFQCVGIAEALLTKSRVMPGMRFVDELGNLLLDWPRSTAIGRHGWHGGYRLHQPALEALLRGVLVDNPLCTLVLEAELVAVTEHRSGLSITYCEPLNNEINPVGNSAQTKQAVAKFVVGCDGANSTVRKLINTNMEDLGFKERWLVVDVLLKQHMPELGDYTVQYCSASQPMTYCRNPGLRRRWEMALPDDLTDEQASLPTRIWPLLSRWINPENAELERTAVYTFRSEIAQQWHKGRLFIAGDAAHLTPPFMGQGMCAGIRDASNLAWKLAHCVKYGSDDALLASYQQERAPHTRKYIETAISLGELIGTMDASKASAVSYSKPTSAASSETTPNKKIVSPEPRLGAAACFTHPHMNTEHTGFLFSQPCLSDGTRLDDFCGYEAVLIVCTRSLLGQGDIQENALTLLFADEHPVLADELEKLGVQAVLLRPDRYILATAKKGEDIASLANMLYSETTAS